MSDIFTHPYNIISVTYALSAMHPFYFSTCLSFSSQTGEENLSYERTTISTERLGAKCGEKREFFTLFSGDRNKAVLSVITNSFNSLTKIWEKEGDYNNRKDDGNMPLFEPRRFPLEGPHFSQAYKGLKHTAKRNFQILTKHGDFMEPHKWHDTLTPGQAKNFCFVEDNEIWRQSAERIFELELEAMPVLGLAVLHEDDGQVHYIVVSTHRGTAAAFPIKRLMEVELGWIRLAELIPQRIREWLQSPGIVVIYSGLTQFLADPPVEYKQGLKVVNGVDTEHLFRTYAKLGVIKPHYVPDVGDLAWQMAYSANYSHRPISLSKFEILFGKHQYNEWPEHRAPSWRPASQRIPASERDSFVLYFEGVGPQLFVNRLMRHGMVYGGMKGVLQNLPLMEATVHFLNSCNTEVAYRDPLGLATDFPEVIEDATGKKLERGEKRQVEEHEEVEFKTGKDLLEEFGGAAIVDDVEVVEETEVKKPPGKKRKLNSNVDVLPVAKIEPRVGDQTQVRRPLAERLGPQPVPAPVPVPAPRLQGRLGPTVTGTNTSPQPLMSVRVGERDGNNNKEGETLGKSRPDYRSTFPSLTITRDLTKEGEREVAETVTKKYQAADVRSMIAVREAAQALAEDGEVQRQVSLIALRDKNLSLAAKMLARRDPDGAIARLNMPFATFKSADSDFRMPASFINKRLLDHDVMSKTEKEQNPYNTVVRYHRKCTYCGSGHCSKQMRSSALPNCNYFKEQVDYAPTRRMCDYRRCRDATRHQTVMCPFMHNRCAICQCRGHDAYDKCDIKNAAIMARLRADFEEHANVGFYTEDRRKFPWWGWYPYPPSAPTEWLVVSYDKLNDMNVMGALALLEGLLCLPENQPGNREREEEEVVDWAEEVERERPLEDQE